MSGLTTAWIRNVDSDWDTKVSRCDVLRWLKCVESEYNRICYLPFVVIFYQNDDRVSDTLVCEFADNFFLATSCKITDRTTPLQELRLLCGEKNEGEFHYVSALDTSQTGII